MEDPSETVRAVLAPSSPEETERIGRQEEDADGAEIHPRLSVREGFSLSLKPLHENDGSLYLQYKVATQSIVGWENQSIETGVATQRPTTQKAVAVGTERLRVGQTFRLEKGVYAFDITFARKVE